MSQEHPPGDPPTGTPRRPWFGRFDRFDRGRFGDGAGRIAGRLTGLLRAPRWSRRYVSAVVDRLQRLSLSWRLISIVVTLVVVALSVSSLLTSALLRNYLVDRAKEELRIASGPVADGVDEALSNSQTAVASLPSSSYVVILYYVSGREYTVAIDERFVPDIPTMSMTDPRVLSGEPFFAKSKTGSATWLVRVGVLDSGYGLYAVGTSLAGPEQTIAQVRALATGIGLVVVAACVLLGWFGIRRAFHPLREIEDTAAAIAAGDLTRRVPVYSAQDEVASLSRSLNAMLTQVESSFAVREASEGRMRRFVTDASHELRTPLATIRGYAELYRQGAAASPEATGAAMRRIEDEAKRMSGLVDDLLTLARLDNRRPNELTEVDLTVVAADAVQDAKARDPQRAIRLTGLADGPLRSALVRGDEARMRQIVTNLLANALVHTPAASPVEVCVGAGPDTGTARLLVRDHGDGIPPERAAQIFERFYRADPARGRVEERGHGLGLAIVAAIVEAHHGRVGVSGTPGGGATFIVDLPSVLPDPGSLDDGDADFDDYFDDEPDSQDVAAPGPGPATGGAPGGAADRGAGPPAGPDVG